MLLHQQIDVKLVSPFHRRPIRSAQLQTARTRTHCLKQRQRLRDVFASLLKVAAFLLRTGDAFQSRGSAASDHRYCGTSRAPSVNCSSCFFRLFKKVVDFAEICKRHSFAANIAGGTLNLNA